MRKISKAAIADMRATQKQAKLEKFGVLALSIGVGYFESWTTSAVILLAAIWFAVMDIQMSLNYQKMLLENEAGMLDADPTE
jgi:hypothetical protein